MFSAITKNAPEDDAIDAKSKLTDVAVRQERRERAFYKMTGFPVDAEDLGAVLREQATT